MASHQSSIATGLGVLCLLVVQGTPAHSGETAPPAFPGALGQGASASGGRGGDVYHVTNLLDYDSKKNQTKIPGSFRHAVRSAEGPRTIVFDVSGAIALAGPFEVIKDNITIAGQTSPGGITLWGYPFEVSKSSNVIIRHLRIRTGDFHARSISTEQGAASTRTGKGNNDLAGGSANAGGIGHGCERVIFDHMSFSWGMDETLSVTNSKNITVQNCIIAESLNDSYHAKGPHGYGTLVRGLLSAEDQEACQGGYTFAGNLWAHHRARNPSIAGQQRLPRGMSEADRLRTDINLVNNVIYDWGEQPTHRSRDGQIRVNLIGNYYINGSESRSKHIFNEDESSDTHLFHRGNYHDANQNELHDGSLIATPEQVERAFRRFDDSDNLIGEDTHQAFPFLDHLAQLATNAEKAYENVVDSVGASLHRDAVDARIINSLVNRSGALIDSQEEFRQEDGTLSGIDDIQHNSRPSDFDTDQDGMPDEFEESNDLDPKNPDDGNLTTLSPLGFTNLEIYLNEACLLP